MELKTKLASLKEKIKDNQNPLDFQIADRLQSLKPNKACGTDGLLNKMIKYINDEFKTAVIKSFNTVLSAGYFPDTWKQDLITPIFKQGDKSEPITKPSNMTTTEAYVSVATWGKCSALLLIQDYKTFLEPTPS